ncbi:MAG: hypothetical protein V1844_05400 [Pseudomonadota bacterium]
MINVFNSDAQMDAPVGDGLNLRQKIVVVTLDVLLLIELCIAMYFANLAPDAFTPTFVKTFFSLLLPTVLTGLFFLRRFKTKVVSVAS